MTTAQPVTVVEIERKYVVPVGFQLPDLTLLSDVTTMITDIDLVLDATYFDTADLALARCGITLRRRSGGHDAGWHLKAPALGARVETQLPITDSPDVPAPLLHRIADVCRGEPLQPIARIRTRRRETRLIGDDGAALAVVADDAVDGQRLLPPQRRDQWREVEVELVDGKPDVLDAVESAFVAGGASLSEAPSKLIRTLGFMGPATASVAGEAIQIGLCRQREELLRWEPLARAGDADGVHNVRVAARRIRAIVRTYGPLLRVPGLAAIDTELRWLANVLGAARDLDVLRSKVLEDIAGGTPDLAGGPAEHRINLRLTSQAAAARTDLAAALASVRYLRVVAALGPLCARVAPDVALAEVYGRAYRGLTKSDRRMNRAMTAGGDGDTATHAARKAFKQARYAIEVLVPLSVAAQPLVDSLTALQNALGDCHDAMVAAAVLRELAVEAREDHEPVAAYRRLWHRQEAAAADHRAAAIARYRTVRHRQLRAWLNGAE